MKNKIKKDIPFTFRITNEHMQFLSWFADKRNTNEAQLLRDAIDVMRIRFNQGNNDDGMLILDYERKLNRIRDSLKDILEL